MTVALASMSLSLPVFLLSLGGVVGVAALVARGGRRRWPLGRTVALTAAVYSLLFWGAVVRFVGVERKKTLAARWEMRERGGRRVIVLDAGNGYGAVAVSSPELERYLTTEKPRTVRVTFPVIYDFGAERAVGMPEQVDGIPLR